MPKEVTRLLVRVLFCCQDRKARLLAAQFWKIVLGGTAALHAPRVWGAVSFWGKDKTPIIQRRSNQSAIPAGTGTERDHVAQPGKAGLLSFESTIENSPAF